VWGGGGGRERRNKLLFQKAWGTEGQIATALPENPVLVLCDIVYVFSPGHAGLRMKRYVMSGVWFT